MPGAWHPETTITRTTNMLIQAANDIRPAVRNQVSEDTALTSFTIWRGRVIFIDPWVGHGSTAASSRPCRATVIIKHRHQPNVP